MYIIYKLYNIHYILDFILSFQVVKITTTHVRAKFANVTWNLQTDCACWEKTCRKSTHRSFTRMADSIEINVA